MAPSLESIIKKLELNDLVDSVFLTGSQGVNNKKYSDIDLVVLLKNNKDNIKSIFTWIEGKFAEIYFFDQTDLDSMSEKDVIPANSLHGCFVTWLGKSDIKFDKSGTLTSFRENLTNLNSKVFVSDNEKDSSWRKINYNYVANLRYFESGDSLYHEALEIRLLYSVLEILTAYFEFRGILWRGEKNAIKYLSEHDVSFYESFVGYGNSASLKDKFNFYSSLFNKVFTEGYKKWEKDDVIPQPKDGFDTDKEKLKSLWEEMIS